MSDDNEEENPLAGWIGVIVFFVGFVLTASIYHYFFSDEESSDVGSVSGICLPSSLYIPNIVSVETLSEGQDHGSARICSLINGELFCLDSVMIPCEKVLSKY